MFFSDPNDFNDPFDSYISFDYEGSDDDWKTYFFELGWPENIVNENIRKLNRGELNHTHFEPIENVRSSAMLKISCFSKEPDNILLWSHYAKEHTGICIGFNVFEEYNSYCLHFDPNDLERYSPEIPRGIVPLIKIDYDKSMPDPYNRLRDDSKRMMEFVYTKSSHWEYEKEYRAILYDKIIVNNPVSFDPRNIAVVIFGLNIKEENIEKVKKVIEELPGRGKWIKLLQCKRKKKEYELEICSL